jgi:hypothetical protein
MSFQSLADVFDYVQNHPEVPPIQVLVLLAIANYANQHGANAYPTLDTLHKTTHLARRIIRYAVRGLEKENLIETELVRGRTGRQTYRLLVAHTPLKKGATDAPIPPLKGASDDTEKGQQMPLELLLNQQGEKKERARVHDEGDTEPWDPDDLAIKARKFIAPASPLWPLMTATATPEEGSHDGDTSPALPHGQERQQLGPEGLGEDLLRGTAAVFLEVVEWYASIPSRLAASAQLGTGVGVWVVIRGDGSYWGSIPRSALCIEISPTIG